MTQWEKIVRNKWMYIAICMVWVISIGAINGQDQIDGWKTDTVDDRLVRIYEDIASYPRALVAFAQKKEEARDFVYDYPMKNGRLLAIQNQREREEMNNGFPYFVQWDARWGYDWYGDNYMAINGCGPTTLAMVIAGLTKDEHITPHTVAQFSIANDYYVEDVGTSWALMTEGAKAFGLQGRVLPLSRSKVIDALTNGEPIIASMRPGNFTTAGHFILLTGMDEAGNVAVLDSDSKVRTARTWPIDTILQEAKKLWRFRIS